MSDWAVYACGVFTAILLSGGLCYTLVEFRRAEKRAEKITPAAREDGARAGSRRRVD